LKRSRLLVLGHRQPGHDPVRDHLEGERLNRLRRVVGPDRPFHLDGNGPALLLRRRRRRLRPGIGLRPVGKPETAKAKNPAEVKTAAAKLNSACNNCHAVFRD
jgi:hypothetical protein